MGKTYTSAELAARIRELRLRHPDRLTLEEVGEWFGVTKQRIHQAEDAERAGHRLDELRVKILSRLLGGVEVRGPLYEVTGQQVLFDAEAAGDGADRSIAA